MPPTPICAAVWLAAVFWNWHASLTPLRPSRAARAHCWSADEARTFLTQAKQTEAQASAFYALALDTGTRRHELLGLTWADVDLEAGRSRSRGNSNLGRRERRRGDRPWATGRAQ